MILHDVIGRKIIKKTKKKKKNNNNNNNNNNKVNNAPYKETKTTNRNVVGYWLVKHDFEPAPMILGFVLGPLMEENLRRAMLIARGDATVFVTRPISATLLAIAAFMLIISILPSIRGKRDEVFTE